MCGPSTHPDAVEVRQRLRILLLAPSALDIIRCPERAVQVEHSSDFLSTDTVPTTSAGSTSEEADDLDLDLEVS